MSVISSRYSEALLMLAKEDNSIEDYEESIKLVKDTFENKEMAIRFFKSPKISKDNKKEVIKNTFNAQLKKEVLHFLYLLIDKNRFDYLIEICESYLVIADEALGRVKGKVYSVRELEASEIKNLQKSFSEKLGKEVHLENHVDESLLMGVRVEIDQKVYDGSLKKQAQELRKQLLKEGE